MVTSIQTCYRHSDRRAGVVCQRCDRPICPECMHQASVGFHCPECARAGTQQVRTMASLRGVETPFVTVLLIVVNALVFLADPFITAETRPFGEIVEDPLKHVGILFGPNVAEGDWWRPITAGFLHADIFHVFFNMFLLYMLGRLIEPALGRVAYLSLYAMSLLGGSLLVLVLSNDQQTLGASGAVFGLMGAAFVGLRSRGVDPFTTAIGPLIVINLIFTFLQPNISIGGHLGGLVAGGVGGWLLFEQGPRVSGGRLLMPLVVAAAAVGLFLACLEVAEPGPDALSPLTDWTVSDSG